VREVLSLLIYRLTLRNSVGDGGDVPRENEVYSKGDDIIFGRAAMEDVSWPMESAPQSEGER
jgi:hypothetical protein